MNWFRLINIGLFNLILEQSTATRTHLAHTGTYWPIPGS